MLYRFLLATGRPMSLPFPPTILAALALAPALALGAGCHIPGPTSIKTGRDNYNVAIQQTNNEQLLLNLVRLRYRDTPLFLEVSSVTTNFTFEVGSGAGGTINPSAGSTGTVTNW